MERRTLLLAALTLPTAAHACLNDRDTDALSVEAQKFPNLVAVITGRFERNPPRYYALRRDRIARELAADPTQFALYDDIAVACDKLHDDDAAIAWMARKKAQMDKLGKAADKEAWYRYHANLGTFLAHRWFGSNTRFVDNTDLKAGRDHIARALEIKPNAHFGREPIQLKTMEWLLLEDTSDYPKSLGAVLGNTDLAMAKAARHQEDGAEARRLIEGIAGLIVLGAAWESPDLFAALRETLARDHQHKIAHLASLRVNELVAAGKSGAKDYIPREGPTPFISGLKTIDRQYTQLRAEAEAWQKDRIAYMDARFAKGRHPDTNPNFWNDWHPKPPPSLEVPWWEDAESNLRVNALKDGPVYLFGAVALALPAALVAKRLRKRGKAVRTR